MSTQAFHQIYARTLYHLPDDAIHVWLFEPYAARQAVMQTHRAQGRDISLHSAYKTFLHEVIEQQLLMHVDEAQIVYPVVAGDDEARFRLECYPLAALYRQCRLSFVPKQYRVDDAVYYEILYPDGSVRSIFVPVMWQMRHDGSKVLAACGWQLDAEGNGGPLQTDYERIYEDTCAYLNTYPLTDGVTAQGPFFRRLQADITLAAADTPLPIGHEHISFAEALHEDLYFSALEIFQHRLGLQAGDRSLTPGQFLPCVRYGDEISIHIHETSGEEGYETPAMLADLAEVEHWLSPADIHAHLAQIGGEHFSVISRQNRSVCGTVLARGNPVKLAISAGQHANESSGIVGALRAAYALKASGDTDFTLRPLGNPDGYAAFRALCTHYPHHMHHGARYTAAGCDLAYGKTHETDLCRLAAEKLPAHVHLNLHGYPAHEWTRPLSGYVPKGFANWTIPKGYFIICIYRPEYKTLAHVLTQAAIAAIANHPAQLRNNRIMLQRYLDCVGTANFSIAHDAIPYTLTVEEDLDYPVEIIIEAADETVYGEHFRIAHESHFRVVLAVNECLHQYRHTLL